MGDPPADCLSASQRRSRAAAKKAKALAAARARAAHADRLAAAAATRAARAAASYQAANQWHQGYDTQALNTTHAYFKSVGGKCALYVKECWRIEVIDQNDCTNLEVQVNELSNSGVILGGIRVGQQNVPAQTPVRYELDTNTTGVSDISTPTITCY
jgi:hypothetical protein